MQISVKIFDGLSWYSRFLQENGSEINIISVNILKDGDIMVTYNEKYQPF